VSGSVSNKNVQFPEYHWHRRIDEKILYYDFLGQLLLPFSGVFYKNIHAKMGLFGTLDRIGGRIRLVFPKPHLALIQEFLNCLSTNVYIKIDLHLVECLQDFPYFPN